MGSPKFTHRKYSTPSHPWQSERIQAEDELVRQFGLKNKREVWKANSKLRAWRHQGRRIIAHSGSASKQHELERQQLLGRLARLGLIEPGARFDDVLTLEVSNLLSRRLQTQVYHQGLASSMKQSRQFIIHGHIAMGGRVVRTPSQLVPKQMEETIAFSQYSPLDDGEHPMRVKAPPAAESAKERTEPSSRPPRLDRHRKGKPTGKTAKGSAESTKTEAGEPESPKPEGETTKAIKGKGAKAVSEEKPAADESSKPTKEKVAKVAAVKKGEAKARKEE